MRKGMIVISCISLSLIALTIATFTYFKASCIMANSKVSCEKEDSMKTGENMWESITKKLIGAAVMGL